jgi:hypothetical protein
MLRALTSGSNLHKCTKIAVRLNHYSKTEWQVMKTFTLRKPKKSASSYLQYRPSKIIFKILTVAKFRRTCTELSESKNNSHSSNVEYYPHNYSYVSQTVLFLRASRLKLCYFSTPSCVLHVPAVWMCRHCLVKIKSYHPVSSFRRSNYSL